MGVSIITSFVAFPIIIALILLVTKGGKAKQGLSVFAAVIQTAAAAAVIVLYFSSGEKLFKADYHILNYAAIAVEAFLAVVIIYVGLKHRKYLLVFFALIQTAALIVFELTKGNDIEIGHNLYVDRLSMVMMALIALVGGLLAVYSAGYLGRYHGKNPDIKDNSSKFMSAVFLSIAAMTGAVVSNNIIWIYIMFEIIALAVYYMTGYGDRENARGTALKSLTVNMFAGLSFVTGILILGGVFGTLELSTAILIGSVYGDIIAIPAAFIVLAGLVTAIQMPFAGWFLKSSGSVAPAMAVISSVSSVNAGVFIILKLSPVLGMGNFAGITVMMVGGITFAAAAFASISQVNTRQAASYITAAVTGVIMVCAGLGTAESVWAAIMLLIFHSFAKALIGVCSGNAELGEAEVSSGGALSAFSGKPRLAACMLAGISVLFIALLEIVLLRGSSMAAFADSGNILLIVMLCFGCGGIVICFAKWMGGLALSAAYKADSVSAGGEPESVFEENKENIDAAGETVEASGEKLGGTVKLFIVLNVLLCIVFPLISAFAVVPYLKEAFEGISQVIGIADAITGIIVILFVILMAGVFYGRKRVAAAPAENTGGSGVYLKIGNNGAKGITDVFNSRKIMQIGWIASSVMIIIGMGFIIGTLVSLLGGAA